MNSICVATYNGERFIEQQLRSILEQIAPEDEVIVSDDGSTDQTLSIIKAFNDARIKILHSDAHCYIDNFANALRCAKGEIIFLSDQDDVWLPGKYERCISELKTVDLVCTDCCVTDSQLHIKENSYFALNHAGKGILKNIMIDTYCGACMAFRKKILDAAMPFPKTRNMGHDLWLGLVAEMIGTVRFINAPYILYRRHDNSLTRQGNVLTRSNRPLWLKVWSRVEMLYYVCKFKIQYGKR